MKTGTDHRLVEDDRTFQVECVKSSLAFCNIVWAEYDRGYPVAEERWREVVHKAKNAPISEFGSAAAQAFAWLPEILKRRAERAELDAAYVPNAIAPISDYLTLHSCNDLEVVITLLQDQKSYPRSVFRDVDRMSRGIAVYHRMRLLKGDLTEVSLPILKNVGDCVAYAVLILVQNRWGLVDRVRKCRYVSRPEERSHWFLDYRLGDDGGLKRGTALEFCTPQHANRFHQREWRRRQTEK